MRFLKNFFGGSGSNPAESGMPYLNQIPSQTGQYYKPFIEGGNEASNVINPIYERMSRDPNEFLSSIMRNYNTSEGYQFKKDEMSKAASNDAAAGGFLGTPYSQQQQAELVQGLLSQDMQDFLKNILGIQGAGMEGEQNRVDKGFNASTGYGDIVGSNLGQQAGLAFQGQAQNNAIKQDRRNNFFKFLANAAQAGGRIAGAGMGTGG